MKTVNLPTIFLLTSAIFAGVSLSASATAQAHPPVVQNLVDRGVTIKGTFDGPSGLTGYVGNMEGQAVAFYLTPDREHVVVGSMLDAEGQNLTEPKIQELALGPQNERAWSQLEDADWVVDGDPEAPVVVYTFTDPNCPYCHRFRQAAKPWIEAGRVQLRHILVGILREDSLPKSATIMGARSPSEALSENQERYPDGGINVIPGLVSDNTSRVQANNQLMTSLGLGATPSTFYLDNSGNVQTKQGAPRADELEAIMGSERPD